MQVDDRPAHVLDDPTRSYKKITHETAPQKIKHLQRMWHSHRRSRALPLPLLPPPLPQVPQTTAKHTLQHKHTRLLKALCMYIYIYSQLHLGFAAFLRAKFKLSSLDQLIRSENKLICPQNPFLPYNHCSRFPPNYLMSNFHSPKMLGHQKRLNRLRIHASSHQQTHKFPVLRSIPASESESAGTSGTSASSLVLACSWRSLKLLICCNCLAISSWTQSKRAWPHGAVGKDDPGDRREKGCFFFVRLLRDTIAKHSLYDIYYIYL